MRTFQAIPASGVVCLLLLAACSKKEVKVDPRVWDELKLSKRTTKSWRSKKYDVVVAPGRKPFVFAGGRAILYYKVGSDIASFMKKHGIEKVYKTRDGKPARSRSFKDAKNKPRPRTPMKKKRDFMAVRLPVQKFTESDAKRELSKIGFKKGRVSSILGLKTLGLVSKLKALGTKMGIHIAVDTILRPSALLTRTTEGNNAGGTAINAMNDGYWADGSADTSRAWQLTQISEDGPKNPWLAIVDCGFDTNTTEISYDAFIYRDGDSAGNVVCDSGSWHGTTVTSAAIAPVNDSQGAAGSCPLNIASSYDSVDSPGPVWIMQVQMWDETFSTYATATEWAVQEGADVVNLSHSGDCDWWCRNFGWISGWNALSNALLYAKEHQVPVLTSAGNDGDNLNKNRYQIPCEMAGNKSYCVGAVNRAGNKASFTNYGTAVDCWSPGTGVWVGPEPSSANTHRANGTSLASPIAAGIVATAEAISSARFTVDKLISETRNTFSTSSDSDVSPGVFNAYRFIRKYAKVAADKREPNDYIEDVTSAAVVSNAELLTLHTKLDVDFLPFNVSQACSAVEATVTYLYDNQLGDISLGILRSQYKDYTTSVTNSRDGEKKVLGRNLPQGRMYLKVTGTRRSGQSGLTTGYSVEIRQLPPATPATEVCDCVDNDCDGQIDEGFTDTDGDGQANCCDKDDDRDCVPDTSDNCPLVSNANQFCPQADPQIKFCGDFCPIVPIDGDCEKIFWACIGNPQIDPSCFDDGCPWEKVFGQHGPLIQNAMKPIVSLPTIKGKDRVKWFQSLGELVEITIKGKKIRLRHPRGFPFADRTGKLDTRIQSLPDYRRFLPGICSAGLGLCAQKAQAAAKQFQACMQKIKSKPCQVDTDGDGTGDACDRTPRRSR